MPSTARTHVAARQPAVRCTRTSHAERPTPRPELRAGADGVDRRGPHARTLRVGHGATTSRTATRSTYPLCGGWIRPPGRRREPASGGAVCSEARLRLRARPSAEGRRLAHLRPRRCCPCGSMESSSSSLCSSHAVAVERAHPALDPLSPPTSRSTGSRRRRWAPALSAWRRPLSCTASRWSPRRGPTGCRSIPASSARAVTGGSQRAERRHVSRRRRRARGRGAPGSPGRRARTTARGSRSSRRPSATRRARCGRRR